MMPKGIPGSGSDELAELLKRQAQIEADQKAIDDEKAKNAERIRAVRQSQFIDECRFGGEAVHPLLVNDTSLRRRLIPRAIEVIDGQKTKKGKLDARAALERLLGPLPATKEIEKESDGAGQQENAAA